MQSQRAVLSLLAVVLGMGTILPAQDIDSIATSEKRAPANMADQIRDRGERAAFLTLYKKHPPAKMMDLAQAFLRNYPQSIFLTQVYELAARSSFDLGGFPAGLEFARQSLILLPENPLLLVAVADVQARTHQNDAAITSARDALEFLGHFDRPDAVAAGAWPDLKRKQQATAWFIIGRALTQEALLGASSEARTKLLEQSISSVSKSLELDPSDAEVRYLLGVDYFSMQDGARAAPMFAAIYRQSTPFSEDARKQLMEIYKSQEPPATISFESFVGNAEKRQPDFSIKSKSRPIVPARLPAYAGSESCQACHRSIYKQWSESGMAKMLRPYQPQNVIGDFEKNNEFFAGDNFQYRDGKLEITPATDRALFARMVLRNGKHYFEIRQADRRWHTYPVDYTIGSKWQQAYATKLPGGHIHVFPIQYSGLEKKWVNYWKSIDYTGSERSNPYNWEKFDLSSSYQANCAVCHTSQLSNTKGGALAADNLTFREPGVGCEMCHGPSSDHADAMSSGNLYDKKPMEPPVDFTKVNNREFVSICSQCHMQSSLHTPSANGEYNYSSNGKFFLTSLAVPYGEFSRLAFYKDGRFSQTTFIVEALERSQCFRKGQASCGSCHNPHDHDSSSNKTSLKFKDQPDLMCVGCHTEFAKKEAAAAHSHHTAGSEGSQCVSCHMPRIMNAMLFRARSHQIDDIPNAEMTARFGQQDSPNACLLCHTDNSVQWVQSELSEWKKNYRMSEPTSHTVEIPVNLADSPLPAANSQ